MGILFVVVSRQFGFTPRMHCQGLPVFRADFVYPAHCSTVHIKKLHVSMKFHAGKAQTESLLKYLNRFRFPGENRGEAGNLRV